MSLPSRRRIQEQSSAQGGEALSFFLLLPTLWLVDRKYDGVSSLGRNAAKAIQTISISNLTPYNSIIVDNRSSEERRLAKFEAEQAAKEAAEAAAAKAKKGGLFGAAKSGPSRLQMRQEKEAKAAARKKELEQKKFATALEKRAKENKAAFDKKQKEKKKKEAQRRRVLKTDFQQRKGLGRFAKKK